MRSMRAVRARRDSAVTASGASDTIESITQRLRIASLKRERRDDNTRALRSIQHGAEQWEPWQVGLLGMADVLARREDHEALARANRQSGYRDRAAAAARAKRRQDPTLRVARLPAGRPAVSLVALLIRAGVSTHREFNIPYPRIARFIVDQVARRVPAPLRARLLGAPPAAQQRVRIASRLRQTARRYPGAK
jgi:hypothetical protein